MIERDVYKDIGCYFVSRFLYEIVCVVCDISYSYKGLSTKEPYVKFKVISDDGIKSSNITEITLASFYETHRRLYTTDEMFNMLDVKTLNEIIERKIENERNEKG